MATEFTVQELPVRAWVGSLRDLRDLGDVITALLPAPPPSRRQKARTYFRRILRLNRGNKQAPLTSPGVQVLLQNAARENRVGKYSEVLSEPDALSDATGVVFLHEIGDRSVQVYLSQRGLCQVKVIGDRSWAPSAAQDIASSLRRHRPWWWFFRLPTVASVVLTIIYLAMFIGWFYIYRALPDLPETFWGQTGELLVSIFGSLAIVGLAFLCYLLGRKVFPGVEIEEFDTGNLRRRTTRIVAASIGAFSTVVTILQGIDWLQGAF